MNTEPLIRWLNKELSQKLECEVGDEYARFYFTALFLKRINIIFNNDNLYLKEHFKN